MEREEYIRRRNNIYAGLSSFVATACLGVALVLGARYFVSDGPVPTTVRLAFPMLVGLGTAGIGAVLTLYLKGIVSFGTTVTISTAPVSSDLQSQRTISDLLAYIEQLRKFYDLKEGYNSEQLAVDPPKVETKASLTKVHIYYAEAIASTQRNINYIERRSLVSLVLGTSATILAFIVIWALSVRGSAILFDNWASFAFHFIPRATLAVFIELFAFFFLRLHRQSLIELRECNADLRDLSLQYAAVELAWDSPEASARRSVAESLVSMTHSITPSKEVDSSAQVNLKDVADILAVIAKRVK